MSDQGNQPPVTSPASPDPRDPKNQVTNYVDRGGNSQKQREEAAKSARQEKPVVERIVKSEVIVKKKSLGERAKHVISLLDFGAVTSYVFKDVLIPAAKNTLWQAVNQGSERMIFRDEAPHRRPGGPNPGPRFSYQTPVTRGINHDPRHNPRAIEARGRSGRSATRNNYITSTRDEAEDVIRSLYDSIERYEMVSVGDLHQMLGLATEYTDFKWGWFELGRAHSRQVPEGYLIVLPEPEQL